MERVEWFVDADYEIMKYLFQHDVGVDSSTPLIVTPKTLALALDYGQNHMGKRLRSLRDAGLVEQHGHGLYELSDFGCEFLASEVDPDEVEARNPNE